MAERTLDVLREGGEWLGAARNWIKWNAHNGSDVTWGSDAVLIPHLTVQQVEEVAAVAVATDRRSRASRSSSGTPDVRMFPLQSESLRRYTKPQLTQIPWSVAEKAYGTYAARYGRDQSLERLAERGGFGQSEMDVLHPTWREEASEIAALRAEIDRLHSLAPSSGTGDARPSKVTCEHGVDTLTTCDACLSAMMERAGWKRASPSSGTALAPWYEGDGSTVMLPAPEVERRRKLAAKVIAAAERAVATVMATGKPEVDDITAIWRELRALDAASPPPPTPEAARAETTTSSEEG
jgi:hypothetical protein